ncbi:MAG: flagellar hook-associated protein FlgK [Deferribacterota bacterium]|nr:flagellar hook-associated protein FlgK [Deferribacterota bacterium]
MVNMYDSLNKAAAGLASSQAGLNVTGNNINNINTEGYSRQRVEIKNDNGLIITEDPKRVYSDIIAKNLRHEKSDYEQYDTMENGLKSVNIYFNELEIGAGLGDSFKEYFNAWSDLANTTPDNTAESLSKKEVVVDKASVLTNKINETAKSIERQRNDSNEKIKDYTKKANELADEIASINKKIVSIENDYKKANELRDRRDVLLDQLSELVDITTFEHANGMVSVYVANNPLVDGLVSNKLILKENSENYYDIFLGNEKYGENINITTNIKAGKIKGELELRDNYYKEYTDKLDNLKEALIFETNKIYTTGYGESYFNSLTSAKGVLSKDAKLTNDPIIGDKIQKGTVQFSIFDSSGNHIDDISINIDPTVDSLNSIASEINEDKNIPIHASVTEDGRLQVRGEKDYTFAVKNDTTNLLAALQFNAFFIDDSSGEIKVNDLVKENLNYLNTHSFVSSGDNSNALSLANLKYKSIESLNNQTIEGYYTVLTTKIASDISEIKSFKSTKDYAVRQMELKLDEVKGVSLDEEFINMLKFQKAYEANARMVTAIDQMMDTIINNMGIVGR